MTLKFNYPWPILRYSGFDTASTEEKAENQFLAVTVSNPDFLSVFMDKARSQPNS